MIKQIKTSSTNKKHNSYEFIEATCHQITNQEFSSSSSHPLTRVKLPMKNKQKIKSKEELHE